MPETWLAIQGDRKVRVAPETQITHPQVITEEPEISPSEYIQDCAIHVGSLLSQANSDSEQSNFFIYF